MLYTIGHSTLTIEEFLERLRGFGVKTLVDIRHYPGSKRYPHFGKDNLARALEKAGIAYIHLVDLGGRRKPKKDSANDGWRNEGFRGYADYMQTAPFKEALEKLIHLSKKQPTAIMCAEAVPWRCHRSLVSDALIARGFNVEDIFTKDAAKPHRLNPMARLEGDDLVYSTKTQGELTI